MQGWKDELSQMHVIKEVRPSMKGIEAPKIEIEMEDCEECTVTLSFYVISGSNLSHSAHGGREFWSHFEASQTKKDATIP
jgi:hypothetical protein